MVKPGAMTKAIVRAYPFLVRFTKIYGPLPRWPRLYSAYARWIKPDVGHSPPWRCTDIVIESAGAAASHSFNSYFQKWNPLARVGRFCEVPAAVLFAVRTGKPVVVLRRERDAFIRSLVRRFDQTDEKSAGLVYDAFHGAIRHCEGFLVLASFEEVVASPDSVVRKCNERFGSHFHPGDGELPRIVTEGHL